MFWRQNVKRSLTFEYGVEIWIWSDFYEQYLKLLVWWQGYQKSYFFLATPFRSGQRSEFKFTIGYIGRKKLMVAKTGASQKQYHFWNPCNQTSNLRYYLPTLGPSLNFEFEHKVQQPFNILPYNSVTKLIWSEQFDFPTYCIAAILRIINQLRKPWLEMAVCSRIWPNYKLIYWIIDEPENCTSTWKSCTSIS